MPCVNHLGANRKIGACSITFQVTHAHAQITAKRITSLDDTRFDHDLAHGNVHGTDQAPDLFKPIGRILDKELIRAGVCRYAAALGQQAVYRVDQLRQNQFGLLIVNLKPFRLRRLQIGYLRA